MTVYTIKIGDRTFYPIRASDETALRLARRMLGVGETAEVYQGDRRVGTTETLTFSTIWTGSETDCPKIYDPLRPAGDHELNCLNPCGLWSAALPGGALPGDLGASLRAQVQVPERD